MNLEQLYDLHKDMVYNLSLNYLQNHEDAQEITQDVFVAVYRSMDKFRNESSVSTWIYRITINKCLDHIKASKRKKRLSFFTSIFGGDVEENTFRVFDHPGVQLEQKQAMERLFRCINKLPEKQKTALLLSKTENLSQAEIAEVMGLSVKAVESLIQRAKSNLSEILKKNEG